MRSWIALSIALLLPGVTYAQATSTSNTVEYSTSTELLCPDNAVLHGTMCYCKTGYKVSESKCVKDEPPAPGDNEIFEDVLMTATFNGTIACDKLGLFTAVELAMCEKVKKDPSKEWKKISRPVQSSPGIANPWAPTSQQTLTYYASSSQALPPLNPPPPPPEPTPVVEPVPEPVPEPEPVKAEAPEPVVAEKKKVEEKPVEEPAAQADSGTVAGTSTEAMIPATPEAQLASALASQNLVAMSSVLAGLEIMTIPEKETPKAPEPEPTPEPEKKPSLFKRITDWLFGWI